MIRGPAGRCRINAIEPEVAEIQRIDEHIDRANRIALIDPIIKAFRQQRRLLATRPLNETLHRFPRRFSKRIIASMGFLHSLGHAQTPPKPASIQKAAMTSLTDQQARAVIAPWYSLFNVASRGDVKAIQEQILTEDYESCAGYLPGECWGRETSIKVVSNFANSIPDMTFDIKEVLVAGDRVIVRGEVTGTPAGDLFGVPHTGRSFRIMAVDIQTVRDGKIAKTFHMENWLSAIGQLRAK